MKQRKQPEPFLSADTIATIQPDGEVCCQTCGSWTTMECLRELNGHCELCVPARQPASCIPPLQENVGMGSLNRVFCLFDRGAGILE